jgi:hypothetical protein
MSELDQASDRQAMTLFGDATPHAIVARATAIADVIAPLIRERNLIKRIGASEHVYLEGWTLAGTMLGVFATTVRTWEIGDDAGYGATVEARTIAGALVGRADAVVMRNETVGGKQKWLEAPAFQLISMCQTRGASKALRMPLGFVMKLAGYDTTPAEEMEAAAARGETVTGGKGVAQGWKDKAEQDRAHRRMHAFLDEHGLHDLAAQLIDSKGYDPPLSKAQMADLRRAFDRELAERKEDDPSRPAGDDGDPGRPAGANTSAPGHPPRPGADQMSSPGRADRRDENGEGSQESATTPGLDDHDSGGED